MPVGDAGNHLGKAAMERKAVAQHLAVVDIQGGHGAA